MTIGVKKSESPDHIEVYGISGAVEVKITEHRDHIRHFWSELGRLLESEEA